jgi:hypothetical protein
MGVVAVLLASIVIALIAPDLWWQSMRRQAQSSPSNMQPRYTVRVVQPAHPSDS